MADKNDKFWFYAKRYGWGWGLPATWQGWLVLLLYTGLVVATACFVPSEVRLPVIVALSVMLVVVIVFKGEKPARWRWGEDRNGH